MRHAENECRGAHCKCMQSDCTNQHYADHILHCGHTPTEHNQTGCANITPSGTPNDIYEEEISRADKRLPPDYIFVEIGTASGTTALRAIKALGKNRSKRWLFTIDPYGDKPYSIGDQHELHTYGYDDKTYRLAMKDIKAEAYEREVNHTHFRMRSQDFMKVFDQIEFWSDGGKQKPQYGVAYLDGEHSWHPVLEEFRWFYHRMPSGGLIIIDDYNLLGSEQEIRDHFIGLAGTWSFHTEDDHYRSYFLKA